MTNAIKNAHTLTARNPGIDMLRGISIMLVILHHLALRIPLAKSTLALVMPGFLLNGLLSNGYEAVFIFFVVSGFLITSNSLERWGRLGAIDLRAFYTRRAARILPCLLLLLAALSALHLAGVTNFVIDSERQSLGRALLSALGMHLNWYEGQTGYLPANWDVLWSLSIEEAFYLGFPLLCIGVRRDRLLMLMLLVFACALPALRAAVDGSQIWHQKAYLPAMAAISMGAFGALLAARWQPSRPSTLLLLRAAGAAGISAVFYFDEAVWHVLGKGSLLLMTASALALVLSFHWRVPGTAAPSLPGTGWLQSFGRLSYEIYLSHMFVVWLVVAAFTATGASQTHAWLYYLPAIGASWLLGALVERTVSSPCRRFLMRRAHPGAVPPAAAAIQPSR
ncbi:MAG: acyltransferase [Pseudomonadota bacterium]